MASNKLERLFTRSIKLLYPHAWYIKLQVNKLAMTKTPADYIVLTPEHRYLVECKQVTCTKILNARYVWSRLTQERDLVMFEEQHEKNHAYVLIAFWDTRMVKSDMFLLPIKEYLRLKEAQGLQSISRSSSIDTFEPWRLTVYGTNSEFELLRPFYLNIIYK